MNAARRSYRSGLFGSMVPNLLGQLGWALALSFTFIVGSARSATPSTAPGFDPTPVEIPDVRLTVSRTVKSMDLLTLRDIHGLQISPDGKYVAFVLGQAVYESNSYRTGLFVVSTRKGSKPQSLGTAGPPHWDEVGEWLAESPQWSPDSRTIYYRLKRSGSWQVWQWSVSSGEPRQVTRAEHDVAAFRVSSDGSELITEVEQPAGVDREQLADHGILFDGRLSAGDPRAIVDQVADLLERSSRSPEILVWNTQTGSSRRATAKELEAYDSWSWPIVSTGASFTKEEIESQHIIGASVSPDAKKVVYQRWLADPSQSFAWSYPLTVRSTSTKGKAVLLTPGVYFIPQYWWTPDSRYIYYTVYDGDGRFGRVMKVAAEGGRPREVLAAGPDALTQYSSDRSGSLLACIRENTITPPQVALVNLPTGSVRTLVDVNPEFRNLRLGAARRVDVPARHGETLWGHLVLPPNPESGKAFPLVVTLYADSNEFLRGAVGDEYPIQVFAANGIAVLDFNRGKFRTKPDDFANTLDSFEGPIDAIADAVKELADAGIVDPERVAITGASTGAADVAYGISHRNTFDAAIESGGGAFDPELYFTIPDQVRQSYVDRYGFGSPVEEQWATDWRRISTSRNYRRITTPLLINAADSEYILDMQLVTTLRDARAPVELFIYANERHIKMQPKHRYEIYERNVDWLNFWLRDVESADHGKAAQYSRWRELRRLQEVRRAAAAGKN